jgi:FimV-like protein
VPTEFPRDAVDAFGSLDMPLPPRVESSADALQAPVSLSSQPVASPETTARQAVPLPHPDEDTPHIADEITAGTAGHAAVAGLGAGFGTGLGAASFGALKLDFDLELPPSPAQPLPAFTQNDLSRIARNKLELAAEYIELGDLSGARALINEVIETNDPGTRTEARALLSTLAPLS